MLPFDATRITFARPSASVSIPATPTGAPGTTVSRGAKVVSTGFRARPTMPSCTRIRSVPRLTPVTIRSGMESFDTLEAATVIPVAGEAPRTGIESSTGADGRVTSRTCTRARPRAAGHDQLGPSVRHGGSGDAAPERPEVRGGEGHPRGSGEEPGHE